MLKGYRIAIVAAFGWLCLLGASPSPQNGERGTRPASGKVAQPTNQSSESPAIQRPDAGCPDGRDKRQSDLCAQWKAADAARDAANAAHHQVVVGWIGLALGFITMGAAIAAAVYARRAAVATEETVGIARNEMDGAAAALTIAERNADATKRHVEIAENSARVQLQAYLTYREDETESARMIAGSRIMIPYGIFNYGSSPALNCDAQSTFAIKPRDFDWSAETVDRQSYKTTVIHPSAAIKQRFESPFIVHQEHIDAINAGTMSAFVRGIVFYDDVFGQSHCSQISLQINSIENGVPDVRMSLNDNIAT
jgi:hypothetical protein